MMVRYSGFNDGYAASDNPFDAIYCAGIYVETYKNIPIIGKYFKTWKLLSKDKIKAIEVLYRIEVWYDDNIIKQSIIDAAMYETFYDNINEYKKFCDSNSVKFKKFMKVIAEYPDRINLIQHLQKPMPQLYKVLSLNNESVYGSCIWELNKQTEIINCPEMCISGYHLTTNPIRWALEPCRVYKAIGLNYINNDDDDKYLFKSAIITEELPDGYWFIYCKGCL